MKKIVGKLKNEEGFTLIEMTIVILVIAILLIVFLPNISKVNQNVNKTTDSALVQTIEAQKILYNAQENDKAADVEKLRASGYITQEQFDAYTEYQANRKPAEGS